MSWLASAALAVLHLVYWAALTFRAWSTTPQTAQPLTAQRKKLPSHLALLLVADHDGDMEASESLMTESVERAVSWCRAVGINRLTVYDREGVLAKLSPDLRERPFKRFNDSSHESTEPSDIEYPLTPPPSDDSESRPRSPESRDLRVKLDVTTILLFGTEKPSKRPYGVKSVARRRRQQRLDSGGETFTLHIINRRTGKLTVARIANSLLGRRKGELSRAKSASDSIDGNPTALEIEIKAVLEGENGFPEPELMLVHHLSSKRITSPLELHGFPPWQIRLTEFHHGEPLNPDRILGRATGRSTEHHGRPLEEFEFRQALDSFATAEMRVGK